MIAGFLRKLFR